MNIRTVSYSGDIRPLFRVKDITKMSQRGLSLDSYADVSGRADEILERLEAGDMPCDGAWPEERVALFKAWIDGGKLP